MDLIIGAGITGLSYAAFCGHNNYLILEAENIVGGYCKTTNRNGFIWDYSGHFFHFQDENIRSFIMKEIDQNLLVDVVKATFIKYKDRLIDYPFQKNIHQLSKEELIDCLYDLFTIEQRTYSTFKEMLYVKFGKSIAEKFLIPYNTKLYACDLNTLDKDAMGRFFPYASKEDIIRNFKTDNNLSYNASFVYPKSGAVSYVNSVLTHVDKSKIRTNCKLRSIDLKNHTVYTENGEKFTYDRLISTIPFPQLLGKGQISYDEQIYNWNQVLVFNLGFDCNGHDLRSHWIYFPEGKYCFYRVGFYSNILSTNRLSLYVEIGFNKKATINKEEYLKHTLDDLKTAGIITEKMNLVDYEAIVMDPAYVHINAESIKDVQEKKKSLASFDVYSIGRYGSWTYCSIEDNIKEAKTLAEQLNHSNQQLNCCDL